MAHTFDTKYQGTRANTSPYTFNYTCGAGATLFILSIVVDGTTARAGGAPTYNGVAMTQADIVRSSTETKAELWYQLNPPTGSAYQVSIPNTGTRYLSPVASSYKAASGYTSALRTVGGNNGTSTNPTGLTLTGLAVGDVIIAVVGTGANSWSPTGRTGIQLYDRDDGTYGNGAQYLIKVDANNTAMAWTFGTSDDWAIVEAAFKEDLITITIHYRRLFFNATDWYSIQDGVKPHLKCPNCGFEWQGLKQAASDINELVTFQCPNCLKNIGFFIKVTGSRLTVQRSDAEGAGGIP